MSLSPEGGRRSSIASSPFAGERAKAAKAIDDARQARRQAAVGADKRPTTAPTPDVPTQTNPVSNTIGAGEIGEHQYFYWARTSRLDSELRRRHLIDIGAVRPDDAALVTVAGVRRVYDELYFMLPYIAPYNAEGARAAVLAMGDYTTEQGSNVLKERYNDAAAHLRLRLLDITEVVDYNDR